MGGAWIDEQNTKLYIGAQSPLGGLGRGVKLKPDLEKLLKKYKVSQADIEKVKDLTTYKAKKTIASALDVVRYNIVKQGLMPRDNALVKANKYISHCIEAFEKKGKTWEPTLDPDTVPEDIKSKVADFIKAISE